MVMKPEPVVDAVESLGRGCQRVIMLSPAGRRLDQALARELATAPWLVLICGRYEGVDERVVEALGAEEVSIGDYVAVGRRIGGVRAPGGGHAARAGRPRQRRVARGGVVRRGAAGPSALHAAARVPRPERAGGAALGRPRRIAGWRRAAALEKTRRNRPDLLADDREAAAGPTAARRVIPPGRGRAGMRCYHLAQFVPYYLPGIPSHEQS